MRPIPLLALILLPAAVNACTTVLNRDCARQDWQETGRRDGMDGKPPAALEAHEARCGSRRIRKNRERYMAGRERGLAGYCTPARGYREGMLGQPYHEVCPEGAAADFRFAYHLGGQVNALLRRQDDTREMLKAVEDRLAGAPAGGPERARLAGERARLTAEMARIAKELERLERQSAHMIKAAVRANP